MTEIQRAASTEVGGRHDRPGTRRLVRILQELIVVYGSFLAGVLAHAWWSGDDDLVFWPWSLAFVLLLMTWLIVQRRASRSADQAGRLPSS